ncbi:MAG: polyphenol oxidase family protein [Bryobacteraceae bacterium]
MFYRDPQNIYRVSELDRIPWLEHGFGTRRSNVAQNGMLATLHQIHSAICLPARGRSGLLGDGDALLENTPGRLVGVKTADCIPILLVDEQNRAVAAVHAGWRGTAAGIAGEAIARMAAEFSTRPERLHAAIGPGIGKCCYEVGPEVAAQFGAEGPCKIDLPGANHSQLLTAGVPVQQIYTAGLCTMCGVEDFDSFRRDKEKAGRMISFAGVK